MPKLVAIHSGPIVALFDGGDERHAQALEVFQEFRDDTFLTMAVITEAMYLLDSNVELQTALITWIRRGAGRRIAELRDQDWNRIEFVLAKYRDQRMDFADATLVALCERESTRYVATLDSDFQVYRYKGKQNFLNVFPA
jgi:predicted nucleic acid-binding protein